MRATIAALLLMFSYCAAAAITPLSEVPEKRGTEESPLSVRITQGPPKTPEELSREDRDRAERLRNEDTTYRLGRWTVAIAAITALILAIQAVVFAVQASRLRESIDEAK